MNEMYVMNIDNNTLPLGFTFIIHFRVPYTLAHCAMFVAKELFIKQQLLFSIMNNMKGHASIQNGTYVMNIDGNMIHP